MTTPRRVRVVGNSGSGKTTLARALARRLDVPHLELDAVFWDAGWTHRDLGEAHGRLAAFLAGPGAAGWVVDGNWSTALNGALDDVEVMLWLDYPRRVVMPRVLWRTVLRGVTRRELWHGNRERLANLVRRDPEENIVRWAWTQHDAYRERYTALSGADPRVVRLRSPREARDWLRSLSV
ncbi:toxin [Xylanimonas ulmi]|uniref:Adenylate kinase family enzyme n=1 Tax=Xylanimonas ulmi TaxID=228973 RepID=A0A4Q7M113_9MICO|nr:toxin [Xylanibacterium ulmi]RZS60603.1 adenylate kinase family enzyme [Xylanibacterium ulmi]